MNGLELLTVGLSLALAGGVAWRLIKGRSSEGPAGSGPRWAPGYGQRHSITGLMLHWAAVLSGDTGPAVGAKTAEALVWRLMRSGVWRHLMKLGFDPLGPAAVCLHETGFGLSYAARVNDNLFGVSYADPAGKWQPFLYDSLAHCVEHWLAVVKLSRYAVAWDSRGDSVEFLRGLKAGGYNGESWLSGVLAARKKLADYLAKG